MQVTDGLPQGLNAEIKMHVSVKAMEFFWAQGKSAGFGSLKIMA